MGDSTVIVPLFEAKHISDYAFPMMDDIDLTFSSGFPSFTFSLNKILATELMISESILPLTFT
ncbi:MAG: hypothetical protein IJ161_12070 [Bacteroidales bacterium]|nr:hypothetical protein [Bacteroidales bacterium]